MLEITIGYLTLLIDLVKSWRSFSLTWSLLLFSVVLKSSTSVLTVLPPNGEYLFSMKIFCSFVIAVFTRLHRFFYASVIAYLYFHAPFFRLHKTRQIRRMKKCWQTHEKMKKKLSGMESTDFQISNYENKMGVDHT